MSAAPGRHERPLRDAAGLAAVYCLLAVAAILLARQPGSVASVWFANATGIALLAHRAHARWPALLATAACANVAAHWMVGDTLALSLSFFPASLLEIAVGAWLLQRSGPVERFAEDTGQLLRVLLAGALLPQLLGATVSALTLQLLGLQRFALVWDDLYISRALGAVAMLPVALAAVQAGPRAMLTQLAAPASVALLAGTAAVGFGSIMALPFPFVYLCIPLVAGALLLPLAASLALALEVVIVVTVATSIGLLAPTDSGWRQLLIYSAAIAAVLPAQFLTVAVARQRTLSATLAALNSATVDLISFIDNGGLYRAVNRAHESYFGLQRAHILGRHIGEVLPRGRYQALVEPNVARAMAGETVNFTAEIDYPGRGVRTMDLTCQPALDAHGARLGVILNAHDITALTATQRDLEHSLASLRAANENLEQFVRISSHDLREPLNTMVQFADLINADHGSTLPAPAQVYLGHVADGARRMRTLLDDMLDFVRTDALTAQELVPVALDDVLTSVVSSLAASIGERSAEVRVGALPIVLGQHSLLALLFQNLVSNAIKFVPPGRVPQVEVSARMAGCDALIEVTDNGIGIEPGQRALLFTPFKRLHARRKFEGTGLGLAICKRVVRAHGGSISIEPRAGEGSCFVVRLKAAASQLS